MFLKIMLKLQIIISQITFRDKHINKKINPQQQTNKHINKEYNLQPKLNRIISRRINLRLQDIIIIPARIYKIGNKNNYHRNNSNKELI